MKATRGPLGHSLFCSHLSLSLASLQLQGTLKFMGNWILHQQIKLVYRGVWAIREGLKSSLVVGLQSMSYILPPWANVCCYTVSLTPASAPFVYIFLVDFHPSLSVPENLKSLLMPNPKYSIHGITYPFDTVGGVSSSAHLIQPIATSKRKVALARWPQPPYWLKVIIDKPTHKCTHSHKHSLCVTLTPCKHAIDFSGNLN